MKSWVVVQGESHLELTEHYVQKPVLGPCWKYSSMTGWSGSKDKGERDKLANEIRREKGKSYYSESVGHGKEPWLFL